MGESHPEAQETHSLKSTTEANCFLAIERNARMLLSFYRAHGKPSDEKPGLWLWLLERLVLLSHESIRRVVVCCKDTFSRQRIRAMASLRAGCA